ncbi:NAD(+) synthase [Fulvivirgaceae bacterium BMA10]|uniref:Glutamine-dependent NAD(+) synthetase n=1 Tax=Splendidivirga corallicola TaxID=3051826 RepID=A0ABT8KSK0_9BACT|nr:NAD(+) synthase [Fulvivirgaceae bacterium BMA10]
MSIYKIAGATLNQTPIDWQNNVRNIIDCIEQAKDLNIDILCLPELCISGYGCEDLFLSDWLPEKAVSHIPEIANHCKDIIVALGVPVRYHGKLYNCVCLIKDQQILGFNAKQYLANDGVHYEPRWFTPWKQDKIQQIQINGGSYPIGDLQIEIEDLKIGFEICEDAWRGDDRPACRLYEKGVNLILNPSASHFALSKTQEREDLIAQSSKSFQCTYVYANLLGNEAGRMIYDGEIIIAQEGRLLQRNNLLSFKEFNIATAEVDLQNANNSSAELIANVQSKYAEFIQATSLAMFDYMRKSFSKGFILSLSGGADSSTCAIIVAEMVKRGLAELGLNKFLDKLNLHHLKSELLSLSSSDEKQKLIVKHILTCAYQGTSNSSDKTLESARQLAGDIGATFYHWNIDEEVASFTQKIEHTLQRDLTWEDDDITLQNIQARTRSPIIWMLANIKNALLITTSNRSEGDVGYATMDGDTSGSIAPIAAIDKHFIISWLKWAETELGYKSLSYVNNLTPSAELRPLEKDQSDESDLMPYKIIVEIERLAIQNHQSPIEVFKALSKKNLENCESLKTHILKFFRLWSRNQWKRERIAPSFHLDDFNVDPKTWCRFPILSGSFKEELEELEKL